MSLASARRLLSPLAFILVFLLAWFWLPDGLYGLARAIEDPDSVVLWWSFLQFGAPIVLGVMAALLVRRRLRSAPPGFEVPPPRSAPPRPVLILRRGAIGLLLLGYLLTAVRGVSAVHSFMEERAFHSYSDSLVWSKESFPVRRPWLRFGCDIPLLPGFVFSYSEAHPTRGCGWGGWTLFFWAGGEPRPLKSFTIWVT